MWVLEIQTQAAMRVWHFTHSATSPASLMYIFNASTSSVLSTVHILTLVTPQTGWEVGSASILQT